MSTIQISDELINEIQNIIQKHDSSADNPGVSIQYLSAIVGYLAAGFPGPLAQKQQILQQLYQFSDHVLSENSQSESDEAYGVWKPK